MPKIKIVLLNGGINSGKDTGAQFLCEIIDNSPAFKNYKPYKIKFSTPLKNATHVIFGMEGVDENHFEEVKDIPNKKFNGLSPRAAYIIVDKALKLLFGNDYLGKIMASRMQDLVDKNNTKNIFFVSDCGFDNEVVSLMHKFSAENILIIRLFKKGCTFKGDSRSYVEVPGIPIQMIENVEGYQLGYKRDLENILKAWLVH